MRTFGIPFEEIVISLDTPETRASIVRYSSTGRVPALIDDDLTISDSLAIIEYVAETFPQMPIWPQDKGQRALARSLAAEMHSGFEALRSHCPTQFLRAPSAFALTPAVEADVARIEAVWRATRARFGAAGPFLFGAFSAADAMFAPVVNRFHAYDIAVGAETRDFMAAIMALPAWREWIAGAEAEVGERGRTAAP